MWEKFTNAVDLAITANAQGMLLFICGTFIMTLIHILHAKAFIIGLKGENHLWESPEILTYLITWLLPEFLMADAWLGLRLSDAGYLILGEIVLFALMGRLGLEYMLSLRGRKIEETKVSTESGGEKISVTKKETTQTDTKKENPEASTSGPEIL